MEVRREVRRVRIVEMRVVVWGRRDGRADLWRMERVVDRWALRDDGVPFLSSIDQH